MKDKFLNIILISSDWDYNHRKGLHTELNKQLSKWSKVVFVEYPYSILIHTLIKFKSRFVNFIKNGSQKYIDNINIFTPIILFHDKIWRKSNLTYKIDSYLIAKQVSKFIKNNYPEYAVILWTAFPYNLLLTRKLKHDFLIYDYYDNFSFNFDGNFNESADNLNKKLIKNSNMILCTAGVMLNSAKEINRNVYYIPNGHNFNLKKIGETNKVLLPVEVKIIGYLGNIRDWIDFKLINELLEKLKDDQYLIFVGPVEKVVLKIVNELKKNSKFIHINKVPYEDTWKYIKSFDTGIIPFKINKFTEGVLPYKFYEYIACGIPIISTALPDIKQFGNIIKVADNNEDFVNYCISDVYEINEEIRAEYSKIAESSTWQNRAEKINLLLKSKTVN